MYIIKLKEKPQTCLECPCLQTYSDVPSDHEADYMIRYCSAMQKYIAVIPQTIEYPEEWMNFEIPEWCPIEELKIK